MFQLKVLLSVVLGFLLLTPQAYSQDTSKEQHWVDSIYSVMSDGERIGQLFMIRAHSNKGKEHEERLEDLVQNHQVGGLCFFQGTPDKQAQITNELQGMVNHVPLLVATDAEWGLGMRLKEHAFSFPRQLMLGAIQDNKLIYQMGRQVAKDCKRLGIHLNLAPVVDVNNNIDNPVINTRSFGEDKYNVSRFSLLMNCWLMLNYMFEKKKIYWTLVCGLDFNKIQKIPVVDLITR